MQNERRDEFRWPFPVFGSSLVAVGLLLILIFLPLAGVTTNPYLHFAEEFLVEIGKALLITGAIAWILEIAHVVAYFEDRLFRVFMNPRFLSKLDRTVTLPGVHRAISTYLFGGTDDPEAQDYYEYLTRYHARLAGEAYRRNMDVTVEIEPHGQLPMTKTTSVVTYTVIPVSPGADQKEKYKVPSPMIFDALAGLTPDQHMQEWRSTVIYKKDGKIIRDDKWKTEAIVVEGKPKIRIEKDFEFPLDGELTYHEKVVYVAQHNFPWAMILRVARRTKEVTLTMRWPGARDFHVSTFGDLSERKTIDRTAIGITFHYDDWMVAGHGVTISYLPPPGYAVGGEGPTRDEKAAQEHAPGPQVENRRID